MNEATQSMHSISQSLATISAQLSNPNQEPLWNLLNNLNTILSSIKAQLQDNTLKYVAIASALVSAYAAWQAKRAAQEVAKGRISEVQPVLKNGVFNYDSKDEKIIVNFECKGRGDLYNLELIHPIHQFIIERITLNTNMQKDVRIAPIGVGKVTFRYEDIFGNRYESQAGVENNSLSSDYKQKRVRGFLNRIMDTF